MLGIGYCLPPPEIRDIVDALPIPALSFSPRMNEIVFGKRRALLPLAELARPEEKLAGIRIDGMCNTEGFTSFYTALRVHQLRPDGTLGPGKELHGYPDGAKINSITWLPDGRHLAFTVRIDEEENDRGKLTVWFANVKTGKARPLFQSPDIYLNAVFLSYLFVDNSTLLVSTIPSSRGCLPKKPFVPKGPKIQSKEHKNVIQVRTCQDMLKDEYDEDLFDYYATTQLVLASLDGKVKKIGPPAVYKSMNPSPDGKYILISSIHRPYSYMVPCEKFPAKVYLWTADGKFVRELCDSPTAFTNVRKGMRSIDWRADKPSTLYWYISEILLLFVCGRH
jgi:hypothetical protein